MKYLLHYVVNMENDWAWFDTEDEMSVFIDDYKQLHFPNGEFKVVDAVYVAVREELEYYIDDEFKED